MYELNGSHCLQLIHRVHSSTSNSGTELPFDDTVCVTSYLLWEINMDKAVAF
jgi:hypothetical protein